MFGSALIVFREVLEAALVISIVLAATRGILTRNRWALLGVLSGAAGAVVVAGFADVIANAMAGLGQDLFNAGVLFAAVFMLAWHNIWMASHAKELTARLKNIGAAI